MFIPVKLCDELETMIFLSGKGILMEELPFLYLWGPSDPILAFITLYHSPFDNFLHLILGFYFPVSTEWKSYPHQYHLTVLPKVKPPQAQIQACSRGFEQV